MTLSLRPCLLATVGTVAWGHAAISQPAMRSNHAVTGNCPFCQGGQNTCMDQGDATQCVPPSPCWGATDTQTASPEEWGSRNAQGQRLQDVKHPDGSYWIDQDGGSSEAPVWCPGDIIPIRYYVFTDHNGVWQWESQRASPGEEVEEKFSMITERISVNNYVKDNMTLANYFMDDGVSPIPAGSCKDGSEWKVTNNECMNQMFAETTLVLPLDMPAGETVFRWRWFGSTDTSGQVVHGNAENSLFLNCKDVIIGTAAQCAYREGLSV